MKLHALALALAVQCVTIGLTAQPVQAQLWAGAAKVSITPDPAGTPYPLGGYVAPNRLKNNAKGVHDTCYARAVALSNGKTKCAIVSLDLCFMPANVKTAVMSRIASTKLPASAVFIAATHTHSAPDPLLLHSGNTNPSGKLPKFDPKMLNWFADHIAQAIIEADRTLRPAKLGVGQADKLGLNRNRRGEKLTDDQMTLWKIVDTAGRPIASLTNYAAHPTIYDDDNLDVSGDWAGAFERKMEETLPGSVALFINGAEGDASPNGADTGTAEERVETYSNRVLDKTRALYDTIRPSASVKLSAWTHEVKLPQRKPHIFFIIAAAQQGATAAKAKEYVNHVMPESCVLSFIKANGAVLMGFPGEPTAVIGLAAKADALKASIKQPAVVALTNGWLGYLISKEQYKAGKYEASMSFFGDGIGECMLNGLKAGLAQTH